MKEISFEDRMKELFEETSIKPPESLWHKINERLDASSGNSGWLTMLLIAATISVAMAFPLTIGYQSLVPSHLFDNNVVFDIGAGNDDDFLSSKAQVLSDKNHDTIVDEKSLTRRNDSADFTNRQPLYEVEINQEVTSLPYEDVTGVGSVVTRVASEGEMASYNYFVGPEFHIIKEKSSPLLVSFAMGTGSSRVGDIQSKGFELASASALTTGDGALSSTQNPEVSEKSGHLISFGLGIEVPIVKKLTFQTGIGYLMQKAEGMSNQVLENGTDRSPLSIYDPITPGTVFLSEPYGYTVRNHFLSVPVILKYPVFQRKFDIRLGTGISTNYLINHAVASKDFGQASYSPSQLDYATLQISGVINVDITFKLHGNYSLSAEAGYQHAFNSLIPDGEYYPSAFSVGLKLNYNLKK